MINFFSELVFDLKNQSVLSLWLEQTIFEEKLTLGDISYIFCDDAYLLKMNQKYLDHDTFTDIITFDYTIDNQVFGDVFISIERVEENAKDYQTDFENELHRVMVHGVLHLCGYKDKTEDETQEMRAKEDYYLGKLKF